MNNKISIRLSLELQKTNEIIDASLWSNAEFYADYIAQTFYYVRHSTRLLALAASRLNYENQQKTHLRFITHLKEESNHEKLALHDLNHIGRKLENFPENNSTRLFYEPQYFKIEHEMPLGLMGYILFLEALAVKVCPSLTKKITEHHGKNSATFFRVHGEEDPSHVSEALKMIEDLDKETSFYVEKNLIQTAFAYNQMLIELNQKWNKKSDNKAA